MKRIQYLTSLNEKLNDQFFSNTHRINPTIKVGGAEGKGGILTFFSLKTQKSTDATVMPTESVDQLIEQLKKLKIQENVVLEKLSRAREREREAQNRNRTSRNTTYEVGDRVRITNAVSIPSNRSENARDRAATVRYTKTRNGQAKVFITTDNGFKTWRLENNLSNVQ